MGKAAHGQRCYAERRGPGLSRAKPAAFLAASALGTAGIAPKATSTSGRPARWLAKPLSGLGHRPRKTC
jgi:hypothetical protein